MPTAPQTLDASEQVRVEAFEALGFDPTQALILATIRQGEEQVDVDEVRRLLAAQCPHELALRIVV
jgi:hypothetical protein